MGLCVDGSFSLFQDRVWASVAKCLNCVIAMVDKLQEGDPGKQEPVPEQQLADVITSHNPGNDSYYDSLIWRHPVRVHSRAQRSTAASPAAVQKTQWPSARGAQQHPSPRWPCITFAIPPHPLFKLTATHSEAQSEKCAGNSDRVVEWKQQIDVLVYFRMRS